MNEDYCPDCCSMLLRKEADVGVGTMRGPAYCGNCGWREPEVDGLVEVDDFDNELEF